MFNQTDFAKLAQAKKKAAAPTPTTTLEKVKSVAEAAMEAVTASFPATHRALDERTEQLLQLHVELEQRMETVENHLEIETVLNVEAAVERVGSLMQRIKARKEKEKKQEEAAAPVPEVVPAPVPQAAPVQTRRPGLRFNDVPKN